MIKDFCYIVLLTGLIFCSGVLVVSAFIWLFNKVKDVLK